MVGSVRILPVGSREYHGVGHKLAILWNGLAPGFLVIREWHLAQPGGRLKRFRKQMNVGVHNGFGVGMDCSVRGRMLGAT